jgi:hypothetical protein
MTTGRRPPAKTEAHLHALEMVNCWQGKKQSGAAIIDHDEDSSEAQALLKFTIFPTVLNSP